MNDTREIILKEMLETYKHILNLSQKEIELALLDKKAWCCKKQKYRSNIVSLIKGKDDINEKALWKLSSYQNNKLLILI